MRLRSALCVASALALCGVLPAVAQASTADVYVYGKTLEYGAAAGEVNNVTVSRTNAGFVVTDPGATITANSGCTSNGLHQVTCDPTSVDAMYIYVNDMNDQVTVDPSVPSLPGDNYYQAARRSLAAPATTP